MKKIVGNGTCLVLDSDKTVFFDVDDTLVKWSFSQVEAEKHGITFNNFGFNTTLVPHRTHVEAIKKHKARGHIVVVWSAGGWEWAQEVVKVLGLEEYVDMVMSKPAWYYDDLRSSDFMPEHNRVYKPDEIWSGKVSSVSNPQVEPEDTEDGGEGIR